MGFCMFHLWLCGLSLDSPTPSLQPRDMHVRLTGESKLAVGVMLNMISCVSLCVCPVQPVQGVTLLSTAGIGSSQPATLNWIIGWWRMDELALMLCFLRYHGAYSIFIQNIFPVEMHYVQTRVYLTINVHVHKNLIYFITVSQTF